MTDQTSPESKRNGTDRVRLGVRAAYSAVVPRPW